MGEGRGGEVHFSLLLLNNILYLGGKIRLQLFQYLYSFRNPFLYLLGSRRLSLKFSYNLPLYRNFRLKFLYLGCLWTSIFCFLLCCFRRSSRFLFGKWWCWIRLSRYTSTLIFLCPGKTSPERLRHLLLDGLEQVSGFAKCMSR